MDVLLVVLFSERAQVHLIKLIVTQMRCGELLPVALMALAL